jgi:hypothetical protein
MRGTVVGLVVLLSWYVVACSQKQGIAPSPRTEEIGSSPKANASSDAPGTQAEKLASQTDTNLDPIIKLSPLTVPADWKAAVRERYPKYLEAARKGEPMPEFDMQYKRLSQVEKEYGTNSVNAREIILSDIAEIETPAVAAGLGRLFNVETNSDLKQKILACVHRIEGVEQQKLLTFTTAAKPDQPVPVRKRAIDYLGDLKDPSVKVLLQSLMKDPEPAIREEAGAALEELKGR